MRKVLTTVVAVGVLLAALSLPAQAGSKSSSWTGWISDSGCAAKGANAEHKDCAIKCVKEKGASWVFVNAETKEVLKIENQDAVNADADLGHEVIVTGRAMNGSLHVESIKPAK